MLTSLEPKYQRSHSVKSTKLGSKVRKNSGIRHQAGVSLNKRSYSKPTLRGNGRPGISVGRDLNSLPLKNLKTFYQDLKVQPKRELSYKKNTSKSNRGSAASLDSRKETINLMINNPNTGLSILLREASTGIASSPSIFPQSSNVGTNNFASKFHRDPPTEKLH